MIIGFIGTGNMGGAILKGYAKFSGDSDNRILIHNKSTEENEAMAAAIQQTCGNSPKIEICNDNKSLCEKADLIIIGVKPNVIDSILSEIAGAYKAAVDEEGLPTKLIVSMAAGVSIEHIEGFLGANAKIIRIMPNTPAMVGEAMISMSRNGYASDEDFAKATEVLSAVGRVVGVEESLIHCVIGVSGSSPAYTYMYIQALADAAVANGMDKESARIFAAQSVLGAAKMVLESKDSLDQLRINVCSPGGTTIEAVNKLFENGFMDDVKEGFQAAVERSKELTK